MLGERLTPADLALYQKQGYLVVQGFCRSDEVKSKVNSLKSMVQLVGSADLRLLTLDSGLLTITMLKIKEQ